MPTEYIKKTVNYEWLSGRDCARILIFLDFSPTTFRLDGEFTWCGLCMDSVEDATVCMYVRLNNCIARQCVAILLMTLDEVCVRKRLFSIVDYVKICPFIIFLLVYS